MKIAIIIKYENINNYENIKFRKTCSDMGISIKILDCNLFSVVMKDKVNVYYDGEIIPNFDCIIPRTGSATTIKDAQVYDCIKMAGFNILNDGETINLLMDKCRVHNKLVANNIKTINTIFIRSYNDLSMVKSHLTFPVIVKSNTGSLGWGIYKVDSYENLVDMLNIAVMSNLDCYYIIQEFIESNGEDHRIFMYKDQVISSMTRFAPDGEFITNYSKHQLCDTFIVDDVVLGICKKVMSTLNCDIAGIDLLKKNGEYVVCEVNSAPGFKGLEQANNGLNVVKKLVKEIKGEVN